ncbi:hypothetical protein GCM10025886_14120 [Tetragenococcus halophilus subsp. flandriensis]|uniref:hypothetical protein n=1 Tax=Tetragenococcus halophilus TaxID=51669 RepID=UPI0023E96A29|nr:hypothetical protein [Tetragenococcus halophilus]GMA08261.1 hypothetical protein GCM10025886_14120 [Tetragenococcus halophilus subsp. flandriensis]
MAKLIVKPVGDDWGIFENDESIPQIVLNSYKNSLAVKEILEMDQKNKVFLEEYLVEKLR